MLVFSITVFAIMQAPPGDFLTTYVATLASSGSSITAEQVAALRREYGLDQPIWVQYLKWMQNLVTGNLGLSLEYQRPNVELIGERLALTVVLRGAGVHRHVGRGHPRRDLLRRPTPARRSTTCSRCSTMSGWPRRTSCWRWCSWWLAFAYFGMSITGLFSPEYVEAPWSLARVGNPARPHLAARGRAGRGGHRAADAGHARQPRSTSCTSRT